jgi:protein AFG1
MNLLVRPRACVFRATPRLASAPLVGRRISSFSITNSWSTRPRPALLRPSCQSLSSAAAPIHNSNTNADDDDDDDSRTPLEDRYLQLVRDQHVHADVTQLHAMGELARLWRDLERVDPPALVTTPVVAPTSTFGSWFGQTSTAASPTASNNISVPRGVYLHGGVGCGKTFLMHLFYETLDQGPWAAEKQSIHFHQFMLTVHQEMHKARQTAAGQSDAILPAVIRQTAARGRLICLDEFQVTDVADALYGSLGAWLRRGGHVESAAGGPVSEWSPARPLCALY